MERRRRAAREIDAVERQRIEGRFRVFKGIEANILADGSLDLQPDERRAFEFVVASPHSRAAAERRPDGADAGGGPGSRRGDPRPSARPHVQQPAGRRRPTGRGVRAGGEARRGRSSSTATGTGRTSTSCWRAQALDAGCLFALDSDAHSIGELRFSDYAIAHARLAGVPAERVINCWSERAAGGVDATSGSTVDRSARLRPGAWCV